MSQLAHVPKRPGANWRRFLADAALQTAAAGAAGTASGSIYGAASDREDRKRGAKSGAIRGGRASVKTTLAGNALSGFFGLAKDRHIAEALREGEWTEGHPELRDARELRDSFLGSDPRGGLLAGAVIGGLRPAAGDLIQALKDRRASKKEQQQERVDEGTKSSYEGHAKAADVSPPHLDAEEDEETRRKRRLAEILKKVMPTQSAAGSASPTPKRGTT